ncbi:sterol desaturase family protein [Chitinasiproducens palmae]|uniref:Sterol desaturase/sphingolipid hydroxylase, fatty acid hydroxylase superfamily n=1 Tax=Chitinasiproducens palmae TaxID=1770053 RepID=A0A1H2PM76_9BURK|nr:sterol desaturase family protein [Chitinasiproducens palmae]SDV47595.1 Sterol desaturase/sphingolipid hydroxylase, fatty acid hydroxylase superfamily [Chitinasiproducens palmae]
MQDFVAVFNNLIGGAQTWLFVDVLQPVLFHFGWMGYDEELYDGLYWVIVGFVAIVGMYAILRPLEALWPAERWQNRRAVRVDVFYTWITRLGLLNLFFFFCLQPAFDRLHNWMTMRGMPSFDLDDMWPGVTSHPLVAFLLYLVVLDFAGYWQHRWQHRFGWWWELHAVHHSQQQMSLWSDDRKHLLESVIESSFFAGIALFIGVEPSQFVALTVLSQVVQSVQHANVRMPFGPVLGRLVVSPAFHRRHHAVGYGHEGTRYGCNFGVLFPWWDMLFRSASWNEAPEPTGIRDQLPGPDGHGRDYGESFIAQQWLGARRSARRVADAVARLPGLRAGRLPRHR